MAEVKVIHNKDGSITVRANGAVEHISTQDKEKGVIFDQVKYALISKGVSFSDVSLTEILQRI